MIGGVLPLLLLCAAIGLALSFASRRFLIAAIGIVVVGALFAKALILPERLTSVIFYGLWVSTLLTAALVHLRGGVPPTLALLIALNGAAWAGAFASAGRTRGDLAFALPAVLVAVPGLWLVKKQYAIVLKVLSSWIIAIAALALLVSMVPTAGYEPDHME